MSADRSRCRSCGAPIVWLRTPTGSAMPCNPELVDFWHTAQGEERFVTEDGRTLAGSRSQPGLFSPDPRKGYIPHWATCPHADKHRKGRR